MLERHKNNLTRLAELCAPSRTVEDVDRLLEIEDIQALDWNDEKELVRVAV
jgi:hypothetical protein